MKGKKNLGLFYVRVNYTKAGSSSQFEFLILELLQVVVFIFDHNDFVGVLHQLVRNSEGLWLCGYMAPKWGSRSLEILCVVKGQSNNNTHESMRSKTTRLGAEHIHS